MSKNENGVNLRNIDVIKGEHNIDDNVPVADSEIESDGINNERASS